MLIGIQGGLGSGKTILLLRYLLFDSLAGKTILSNMLSIKGFKVNPLKVDELLDMENSNVNLTDCTVGIDELTVYVDCRVSGKKKNRAFSYFILQSRKRNVNVYYTTQSLSMIDKRVHAHTHFIVNCDFCYDNKDNIIEDWRKYSVMDFRQPSNPTINRFELKIDEFFKYYDTDEIIKPIE